MADFTITATSLEVVSTSDVQGLKLTSAACTYELPTVNPSGATSGAPQAPAAESDNGVTVWHTVSGGGTGSGINSIATAIINTVGAFSHSVGDLASTLVAPITAEITMVGGGGGGSQVVSPAFNTTTAGGGGGATAIKVINGLSPSSVLSGSIGAGGAAGSAGGAGGNGSPTLFSFDGKTYGAEFGGGGGAGATGNTDLAVCHPGAGGQEGAPSGADTAADQYISGGAGGAGMSFTTSVLTSGFGGSTTCAGSLAGGFTKTGGSVGGADGQGFGQGGTGIIQEASDASVTGPGAGHSGAVIIKFFGASA